MPPRKSNSTVRPHGRPASKQPAPSPDEEARSPEAPEDREAGGTEDGATSGRPAGFDDDLPELDDDDHVSARRSPADRDIYGEDELPEEEPDSEPSAAAARVRAAETRIAPAGRFDVEEGAEEPASSPPFRLEITSGPDEGSVERFVGVRLVIGRSDACNVALTDQSVSRRHLELVVGERGVLLRDLGSGNGTRINGKRVAEQMLQHGDEIALGKTRIRFVDEEAEQAEAKRNAPVQSAQETRMAAVAELAPSQVAASSEAAASPEGADAAAGPSGKFWQRLSFTHRLIAVASAFVFLLAVIGTVSFLRKPEPAQPTPRQLRAWAKMEEARQAYEAGRYEEALGNIEQAEYQLAGADERGLRETIRAELDAKGALARARVALSENRFDDVARELGSITGVGERTAGEVQGLRAELDARRTEWLIGQFGGAAEAMDFERARATFAQLPQAKQNELRPRLEELELAYLEHEQRSAQQAAAQKRESARRAKAQREQFVLRQLELVSRKLHARDYERAIKECDRVADVHQADREVRDRALELKRQIPVFQRNFEDGARKFKLNALDAAARPLERAREALGAMKLPGALGTQLDDHLLAVYLHQARQAMAKDELVRAQSIYRDVQKIRPDDPGALAGLDRIAERAEKLIVEAYVVRDRDPKAAVAKLHTVLELTPARSPTHKKAREHLEALQL